MSEEINPFSFTLNVMIEHLIDLARDKAQDTFNEIVSEEVSYLSFYNELVNETYEYFMENHSDKNASEVKFTNFKNLFKSFITDELSTDVPDPDFYNFINLDEIAEIPDEVSFPVNKVETDFKNLLGSCFDLYLRGWIEETASSRVFA